MKTLELDLKKKIFIVDTTAPIEAIEIDDYEFICLGSELTEEIASELVYEISYNQYKNYKGLLCYNSAISSFISAVESKGFYWLENNSSIVTSVEDYKKWQEAEEKTFKNPLIFVKK